MPKVTPAYRIMLTTVECGLRWSQNVVAELSNNYGRSLPPAVKTNLLKALAGLTDAGFALHEHMNNLESLSPEDDTGKTV